MPKMTIIGLTEKVTLFSNDLKKKKRVNARVDTGAESNSLDTRLAAKLLLGPVIKTTIVKSANGNSTRPVIKADIMIADKMLGGVFTLADRSKMRFKMLIGREILKKGGFLIDPKRK
ncbi:ATP-dependent zinc protease [Candidatus Woesearchaeota archaeon]|nr:ATP-dependent zinc protease [Candidatus Woesearchaeota archaeon]